jgi:hypothetical protein
MDVYLLMTPSPRRNLEETLHAFIEKQEIINTHICYKFLEEM